MYPAQGLDGLYVALANDLGQLFLDQFGLNLSKGGHLLFIEDDSLVIGK
jgi:hypothetical protein